MLVVVLAAGATWIMPAGNYDRLTYEASTDSFEIMNADSSYSVAASQQKLDELGVTVSIETLRSGSINKPVSIPGTYQKVDARPQGLLAIFSAPVKGMYEVIDIVLLVLIIGGFIGVFNHSGALDAGIAFLAGKLTGRESLLIIVAMILMAVGGSTFGMAEETLAFFPILVPVFLAAGYDRMVPLSVIFIGSSIGVMASTTNPFATIIASDAAGIDWTVGIYSRLTMWALGLTACIMFVVRYGNKVKKDPSKSILNSHGFENPFGTTHITEKVDRLSLKNFMLLSLFAGTFLIMIVGVSLLGWWLEEMTVLFLIAAIVLGLLQDTNEKEFIREFVTGAKELLGVTFIIGIARAVTIVLNEGNISDTMLYYLVGLVESSSSFVFLPGLLVVYFILALLISSTSGLAVVSMPIMSSLAQIIGVPVEEIVNAYQFGAGLMFFVSPTALILPSLAMVNVNYDTWLKFIWPLLGILFLMAVGVLWMGLLF